MVLQNIGDGTRKIRLTAGGDVTLVTKQEVEALPPDYLLGNIESPREEAGDEENRKRHHEDAT